MPSNDVCWLWWIYKKFSFYVPHLCSAVPLPCWLWWWSETARRWEGISREAMFSCRCGHVKISHVKKPTTNWGQVSTENHKINRLHLYVYNTLKNCVHNLGRNKSQVSRSFGFGSSVALYKSITDPVSQIESLIVGWCGMKFVAS